MKKTMFKIALIGLLAGAFTLAQTVKHFGAWILVPITAAFIGSLFSNYLWYDYKRWCKHAKKVSNNARTQNSKATHERYYNGNRSTARQKNATCKALLQTACENMEG